MAPRCTGGAMRLLGSSIILDESSRKRKRRTLFAETLKRQLVRGVMISDHD